MATRYAFGLIYDRWKLSDSDRNRDAFTDAYGVYCVYDRQDIAEEMGVTLPTVRKAIKALIDHRILKARRAGVGAAWPVITPTAFALLHLDHEFCRCALRHYRRRVDGSSRLLFFCVVQTERIFHSGLKKLFPETEKTFPLRVKESFTPD